MDDLVKCLIQMYIDMWADPDSDKYDKSTIDFLRSSARATRNWLKSRGQWLEDDKQQ